MDPEEIPRLAAQLRVAMDQLARLDEEIEKRERDASAQYEDAARVFAERARNGELGSDWNTVQRRIDSGETTMSAVWSGEDDSAAAKGIRDLAHRNVSALARTLREQHDLQPDDEANPIARLSGLSDDLAGLHDRMRLIQEKGWM